MENQGEDIVRHRLNCTSTQLSKRWKCSGKMKIIKNNKNCSGNIKSFIAIYQHFPALANMKLLLKCVQWMQFDLIFMNSIWFDLWRIS